MRKSYYFVIILIIMYNRKVINLLFIKLLNVNIEGICLIFDDIFLDNIIIMVLFNDFKIFLFLIIN